jgi:hypothetical protein
LHRTYDSPILVFRYEQYPLVSRHVFSNTPPKCHSGASRYRQHEADRRATLDAINQDVGQRIDHIHRLVLANTSYRYRLIHSKLHA